MATTDQRQPKRVEMCSTSWCMTPETPLLRSIGPCSWEFLLDSSAYRIAVQTSTLVHLQHGIENLAKTEVQRHADQKIQGCWSTLQPALKNTVIAGKEFSYLALSVPRNLSTTIQLRPEE